MRLDDFEYSRCAVCGCCAFSNGASTTSHECLNDRVIDTNDLFRYLDQHINDDLIDVAHNIRTKFGLTDTEVHNIIKMWQLSNDH